MSGHEDYDERFEELARLSYQVAHRLTGDRAGSEDVAQEVMTRAYVRWRHVAAYPEPWVVRVTTNQVIGNWRRGSRRRRLTQPDPGDATESGADRGTAERIALVEALRDLPRRQREVAVLRYLGDLSVDDTASALGVSASAVKAHAARALVALRERQELLSPDARRPGPGTGAAVADDLAPRPPLGPPAVRPRPLQRRGDR